MAGLVSGPRILKIVRTPSSRRTGAACFIAAWWLGANMKPTPTSSMQRPTRAAGSMMLAPNASSTSALPDLLETARPPCLATGAPAAATTNAAAVEMLKVCEASPPVPTTSTRCVTSFTATLVASSRMTWAAAAISPIVSFLTRRPTVRAAIMTGVISPDMIMRISSSISSWKISRCSMVRCKASWALMGGMDSPLLWMELSDGRRDRLARAEEVRQHGLAMLGQHRLGMELDAFDRHAAVAHPHDLAVRGPRAHLQAVRHAVPLDHERVIAGGGKGHRQAFEHTASVVLD